MVWGLLRPGGRGRSGGSRNLKSLGLCLTPGRGPTASGRRRIYNGYNETEDVNLLVLERGSRFSTAVAIFKLTVPTRVVGVASESTESRLESHPDSEFAAEPRWL